MKVLEGEWLVDQVAHRCAYFGVGPDQFEELLAPMRIDFDVVVHQQQVVVLRACDSEVALLRTVSFLMMKVTNIQARFAPARIFRQLWRLRVVAAVNDDGFRHSYRLPGKTLETARQQLRSANRGDDRRDAFGHLTRFIQKLEDFESAALGQTRAASSRCSRQSQ